MTNIVPATGAAVVAVLGRREAHALPRLRPARGGAFGRPGGLGGDDALALLPDVLVHMHASTEAGTLGAGLIVPPGECGTAK